MSNLDLKISEGCQEPYVEFHVDGADLAIRIKEAFGEASFDEALPWYGVDYSTSDTVLGEEARTKGAEGAILFACGCGCYACSGVFADVHVTDTTITFSNFSTWWRGGRAVAALDPVVFDRGQFEEAVSRLHFMIESWRPPSDTAQAPEPEGGQAQP